MRRNIVAIILVIVLGSICIWFLYNNRKGTINAAMRDFAVSDTSSINKIFLADKKGRTLTLERDANGIWMLNAKFKARKDMIKTLLTTIATVDVKEPVSKKAKDNIIKELSSVAIKCEIYQNGELTKAYYVGTETPELTGTYMIMMDLESMKPVERPFVTYIPGFEGYLTTRYTTEELVWRDRTVFEYNPNDIKSIKMEVPNAPEQGYELVVLGNNNYEIKSIGDQKSQAGIDPLAVKQYLSYFQTLQFESIESRFNQVQKDSIQKNQPINIITVTDKNGAANKVKFYARKPKKEILDDKGELYQYDPERMYAFLNNGIDLVVVQYYVFGKVMPSINYFKKENPSSVSPQNSAISKPKSNGFY